MKCCRWSDHCNHVDYVSESSNEKRQPIKKGNKDMKIMTPGPTQIRENVRLARSMETTNPDLDLKFYDYYRDTCMLVSKLLHTGNESYLLSGEGILALEAACASLTEQGDRVLVIDNGIFGRGFADFVRIYQGEPVLYTADYKDTLDIFALKAFLEKDHQFKYATVVHCDTPSGVLNEVSGICSLLKEYGILTVIDSVSAMFAEELDAGEGCMDILCGGSQKVLSAPPGLAFVTISSDAFKAMELRKKPIASFYGNLLSFRDYYKNKWFPYTMPISDIYGFRIALENVAEDAGIKIRHKKIAAAVRKAVTAAGLSLYLRAGYAHTVTAVRVPAGLRDQEILDIMMEKYHIMIAGCFDCLAGKIIRIGHMGENCNREDVADTLEALEGSLQILGFDCKCNMKSVFLTYLD